MGTTIRAMLNTDRASKSGVYPLIIRVIHNRKKKLIYSDFKIKKEDFDPQAERVKWSENSSYSKNQVKKMNRFITTQKREMERLFSYIDRQHKRGYSANDIMPKYGKHTEDRYVFTFLEREILSKINAKRHSTAANYTSCRNSLKRFVGYRKLTFTEINYTFVCDYIDYIRSRGAGENTVHMYLRNLKTIYKKAIKQGILVSKADPFIGIRMNGVSTAKRALSRTVIKSIAELDLTAYKNLDCARDLFMFSFYTRGMSLVDIIHLKHTDILCDTIYYTRNKTKQNMQVAITPPLRKLIEKHQTESKYIFSYLKQSSSESLYRQYRKALGLINGHLKRIGKMLELETPLTTYVARHSWATIAKMQGVPVAVISEGLGHSTEQTTQIYLRSFDKSTIDKINAQIVLL